MIVVNKRYHTATPNDVYIGRPSLFGNPFAHKPSKFNTQTLDSPEACMRAYGAWLYRQINESGLEYNHEFTTALRGLHEDAILVCWCKDRSGNGLCHGDILIRAWKWLQGTTPT